jgi:hypothetical protein
MFTLVAPFFWVAALAIDALSFFYPLAICGLKYKNIILIKIINSEIYIT